MSIDINIPKSEEAVSLLEKSLLTLNSNYKESVSPLDFIPETSNISKLNEMYNSSFEDVNLILASITIALSQLKKDATMSEEMISKVDFNNIAIGKKVGKYNVSQGYNNAKDAINGANGETLLSQYVDENSEFMSFVIVDNDGNVINRNIAEKYPGITIKQILEMFNDPSSDYYGKGYNIDNVAIIIGKNGEGQAWTSVKTLFSPNEDSSILLNETTETTTTVSSDLNSQNSYKSSNSYTQLTEESPIIEACERPSNQAQSNKFPEHHSNQSAGLQSEALSTEHGSHKPHGKYEPPSKELDNIPKQEDISIKDDSSPIETPSSDSIDVYEVTATDLEGTTPQIPNVEKEIIEDVSSPIGTPSPNTIDVYGVTVSDTDGKTTQLPNAEKEIIEDVSSPIETPSSDSIDVYEVTASDLNEIATQIPKVEKEIIGDVSSPIVGASASLVESSALNDENIDGYEVSSNVE